MRQWCDLPNDALATILSYLFGKDYINFLAVCRSWRSAPPLPRQIPNPSSSHACPYPSLFHFSGNSSDCRFYDPFYNGSYQALIPHELIDARICHSNYGWLLMSQGAQLFFFQPFTKRRMDLPILRHSYIDHIKQCARMCFSCPPTSPDCMVFGIDDDDPREAEVSIIRRGQVSVTTFLCSTEDAWFDSSHGSPVFYKGAFYCLSIDGQLGVFDANARDNGRWKIFDKLKHPCESIQENFLVESDGELISVVVGRIGEYVRVFQINCDQEFRWVEVHSLADKMIFACRTGSICMQSRTMGNTIYFPNLDAGGNGLFYSLVSRKFHSLELASARKDLYDTRRMLHCAWITPSAPEETYAEDELRWPPRPKYFIPSSGRVTVMQAPPAYPSFVPTNLKGLHNQLFFNTSDSRQDVAGIPKVGQMLTAACAFGWLFQVAWDYSACLLLNPQTMEKIHLPRPPERFHQCAISSAPNDPNCVVSLYRYCSEEDHFRNKFIYCRPGESAWTIVRIKKPRVVNSNSDNQQELRSLIKDRITNLSGCQGKIYGLLFPDILVEVNFNPTFHVKLVKTDVGHQVLLPSSTSSIGINEYTIYMVESQGDLFVIRMNFRGFTMRRHPNKVTEVEVFKLDFTRKIWERVGNLSGNMAFFCYRDGFCVSCSSMEESKRKGNSIYCIGCFSKEEDVYAFHLEDGTTSVSTI
ncbi:hypothetical protein V6N11_072453 [Hibiscus sabdariffa]|uniref:F-box domain-containing protein n=1 Tax=Hibiscus sabdariffa TaxID=183260 RepID=A0ABR2U3M2_9ROSI